MWARTPFFDTSNLGVLTDFLAKRRRHPPWDRLRPLAGADVEGTKWGRLALKRRACSASSNEVISTLLLLTGRELLAQTAPPQLIIQKNDVKLLMLNAKLLLRTASLGAILLTIAAGSAGAQTANLSCSGTLRVHRPERFNASVTPSSSVVDLAGEKLRLLQEPMPSILSMRAELCLAPIRTSIS